MDFFSLTCWKTFTDKTKCLLSFLEVKSWIYWKTLRIKAIKVVWEMKVAEKEGFLCLYVVPILYMWKTSCFIYEYLPYWPPGVKILRTAGQIEGFCLWCILDKICFNLKSFSLEVCFFLWASSPLTLTQIKWRWCYFSKVWWLRNIYPKSYPS